MKKLCDLVEIAENNEVCVILKVKENSEFDLMCLGCFDGNEDMLRLTKGGTQTATIFRKNEKPYSWHWGESGHVLVSDKMHKLGQLIQSCIENDFGIYIRKDKDKIAQTLHIKNK